ncbi:ATP-binding protein [Streptomyces sp. NBC_01261]|uniref:ATP-binding protein n=1 Tax=unclassified Streptomyces TaxID=2593676 RepID=UPI002E2D4E36|nr:MULTISPECIES: ATP-binding protein [unclassified Streptomyces]
MPNDRPRGLPTVGEGCTTILGPGKSSVRQARELVRKRLAEYGLQDLVDIAELLVSELATNAVVHAGGRYRLTLSLGVGILRCEVADERRHLPRPPHRQVERDDDLAVDPDSENGRGLFLVDALAHRWGSRLVEEGKEVWFELEIGASGGAGVDVAETDVHLPAPARPRAQEPHGCTELDHERADHQYSPDGERAEDLGLLGCSEDLGLRSRYHRGDRCRARSLGRALIPHRPPFPPERVHR